MNIKKIDKTLVGAIEVKTNLLEIQKHVGTTPEKLMQEVMKQGINPAGPQIWEYVGCDGEDMSKEFTLKITIPVDKKGNDTEICKFIELPEFKCIETTHNGSWDEFKEVYEKIVGDILKQGHQLTWSSREIYEHCDFEKPENCITHIQVGIN